MIPTFKLVAIAAIASLAAGTYLGYQYASGQAAKQEVKQLTAEEKRRLEAYEGLAAANTRLTGERDRAVSQLEQVRTEQPQTLVKTVIKTVEVPSGATTVDCPEHRIGDDFVRLWNAAAEAYNAMPRADAGDGAAAPAGLRPET